MPVPIHHRYHNGFSKRHMDAISPQCCIRVSYYATQTTPCGTSTQSATVTTQTATIRFCGTITIPCMKMQIPVSGTGYGTGTVRLLIDSVEIGSNNHYWKLTISGLSSGTIYTSGKLTATFEETNKLALTQWLCYFGAMCVACLHIYSVFYKSLQTVKQVQHPAIPYIASSPGKYYTQWFRVRCFIYARKLFRSGSSTSKFGNGSSIAFQQRNGAYDAAGQHIHMQVKQPSFQGSCTETYVFVYFQNK